MGARGHRSAALVLAGLASLAATLGSCLGASRGATPEERATPAIDVAGPATFARNVGPLIHRSCTPCHHPGGSGPFPLVDYEDARRRARQIAVVTETRFMPPWKPQPGFGRFHDERRLSEAEIDLLARWAAEGAPLGDPAELPAPPRYDGEWVLGPPDVVLTMEEPYRVPAEGKDDYRTFAIPTGFERERYVRGFDFRPDNPAPVHHVITLLDRSHAALRAQRESELVGSEGMVALGELFGTEVHGWGPGATPRLLPEGCSWVFPADVDLVLDTHFQTTGRVEPVRISVGLYLTDERPERPMTNLSLSAPVLCIPPEEERYVVDFDFELPVPIEAISIQPHAHYLGKDLSVVARRPDGSLEPLIRIPDWDFSWQDSYRFVEPVPLPAGTRLEMRFVYDNGSRNDRNPFRPARRILSGPRSSDEMALLWLQASVDEADQPALHAAIERHERSVSEQSRLFEMVFEGIVYGFDADGDGMLSAEEDARATAYVEALPEHEHVAAYDLDGSGALEERERALVERTIRLWHGER